MIYTTKKSIILSQGIDKDFLYIPENSQLKFIEKTYYFYHAYYESHSYTAIFHLEDKPVKIKFHRVHNTNSFQIMSCEMPYDKRKMIFWNDVFVEECPLNEEKVGD